MFLAPSIFGGALPEFLDLDYEVEPDTDHVTKFRDDRPMDLGDWALNKKKHHLQNISPSGTVVPGGLKIGQYLMHL